MSRLKELEEAKAAAEEVIARIDSSVSSLDRAKSWGFWDLLGGEWFTSWMKRGKIQAANENILDIKKSLDKLNDELEDVNMHMPSEISDTLGDHIFDVWFDNIFTDLRVQGEIKEALNKLKNFRAEILELIETLNSEIRNLE